ncbi:FAD-binding oxidoreductase [Vannielia litorea]|uniref:FAD-binding oxidoreductase n=1 Tax=Vannielia litorea TaxID=1217970 RepID=UPI001C97C285|nr:FAD-linked oxidase C-terminal domain-containing protein [Vannielia litorea]MBY6049410.1 FAD-binding protein [Vannielia litorea]MBY6076824.1 FAD-binding protein [Vannielia litorea]
MAHEKALTQLESLLGDRLKRSDAERAAHGQNEAHFPDMLPDAVAYPKSTEEVAAVMRIAHAEEMPVVAYGTGTSLEGHHLPVRGGLTIDLSLMNRILAVHDADMDVTVQPGVTRTQLNDELRATGLYFPIDPGADASLGGMAATRASGTMAVRYGTMRENVLALEAVLADGRVIRTGSRARKSSSGYDLTHLLIGSEGTLGIITELTLKLHGQPESIVAATCRFPTVEDAVNCVITTIQTGIPMARIELVNGTMVRGFNRASNAGLPEEPHLFLEFSGSETAVEEQSAMFEEIAADFEAQDFKRATRMEERNALWAMRHNGHHASKALYPGKRILATDVCVPISQLAEAVTAAEDKARELGLEPCIVGHVGDGNFHTGIGFDRDDPAELAMIETFSAHLAETALRLGGTVSGEHGIGLGKRKYMEAEHGPALVPMRAIKQAMDPKGILNPGKVLPD